MKSLFTFGDRTSKSVDDHHVSISRTAIDVKKSDAPKPQTQTYSNEFLRTQRHIVSLAGDDLLVETLRGFRMVVPSWNLDVAVGIIRDGIIEPWTNEVFLSLFRRGDRVVNVGANFGYYSILAAQKVGAAGKVFAIEANPVVFCYLVKGLYWSGYPNVIEAYNCAAVNPEMHRKELKFFCDPQFIGGGNLFADDKYADNIAGCMWTGENIGRTLDPNRKFTPRGLYSEVKTEGRTVDSLVSESGPVQAILIDAEGSESFVITGAMVTIRKSPEVSIIMEWDPLSYRTEYGRRDSIDRMWNFLLDDQKFNAFRICPEDYPGLGSMPKLTPLDRESIFNIPHSDVLLKRS